MSVFYNEREHAGNNFVDERRAAVYAFNNKKLKIMKYILACLIFPSPAGSPKGLRWSLREGIISLIPGWEAKINRMPVRYSGHF